MKPQLAGQMSSSIGKDMALAIRFSLRKLPAPRFPLQDFKETCKEESLIHPSPGEEVVLPLGWGGEGLTHGGSHKSGGWVTQGSQESSALAGLLRPLSGTHLRSLEAWK